jgi:MFS family permease
LGLLTLYWTKDLAFEIATAAFIVGVMRFSGPIGHIVAGYLSDIFGRLRVLIVFTFFFTVFLISSSYLPFGFLLIVSLLLFTALYDGYYPLLFVLISDTTLPQERTKTLGILLAISGIFTAFHLAITGFLAENFGFRIAWIYPIVLSALGCIFVVLLKGRIKIITNPSTQE